MIEAVVRDLELTPEPSVADTRPCSRCVGAEDPGGKELVTQLPQQDSLGTSGAYADQSRRWRLLVMFLRRRQQPLSIPESVQHCGNGPGSLRHNLNWVVPVSQSQALPPQALPEKPRAEIALNASTNALPFNRARPSKKLPAIRTAPVRFSVWTSSKNSTRRSRILTGCCRDRNLLLRRSRRRHCCGNNPTVRIDSIVASFYNGADARVHARVLSNEGYQAAIIPSRVSDDLLLQRVEIVRLKNLKEAMQTWEAGLSKQWLAFVGRSNGGDQLSKADMTY